MGDRVTNKLRDTRRRQLHPEYGTFCNTTGLVSLKKPNNVIKNKRMGELF